MMKISTRGRYALRVMVELARRSEKKTTSLRSIAENQKITPKYLESIIALLVREQLVASSRGKAGGYRLSRPASQYTVYDILLATEGDLSPVQCLSSSIPCPMEKRCPTLPVWQGLQKVTHDYLRSITLEQLAQLPDGEFSFRDGI